MVVCGIILALLGYGRTVCRKACVALVKKCTLVTAILRPAFLVTNLKLASNKVEMGKFYNQYCGLLILTVPNAAKFYQYCR